MALLPSAYNHKALGDIERIAEAYKDEFDVHIITDKAYSADEKYVDGIHYARKRSPMDAYLECTADYIIDAGTISGSNKFSSTQKRISVWHGIPYKKMFTDLEQKHIVTALDYCSSIDLMVSPSPWYTQRFLRQSMLYKGEVLETAVSRTDSLFLTDAEKRDLRRELGIPEGKKIVLYAPTFRERGAVDLPFSAEKLVASLGDDWILVTKLHYLNTLNDPANCIDVTEYSTVNHILAIADLLITDYSSLIFDYSILDKPVLLYQYDRTQYEADRSFMFDMEDYIDPAWFAFTEDELYAKLGPVLEAQSNAAKLKENFYPHQVENSTDILVKELDLDSTPRGMHEVIFLVNELNQIGGVHSFVMNLAREFKRRYNAKIIVMGNREFDNNKEKPYFFDTEGFIDVKLSAENNFVMCQNILKSTEGYIISCQLGAHRRLQRFMKGKKSILMFHGDTKDVVNHVFYSSHLEIYNKGKAKNFRRFALLTKQNCEVLKEALVEGLKEKAIYIENGMDFHDAHSLYSESGDFAFVSRLDPDKNPLAVLDIFADPNLNKAYKLHVYGDGSLRQEMEDKAQSLGIADRVIFHGYVEDKEEIFRDKQGLVSTSLTEGLPIVLLEAAKYSIPVYLYDSFTSAHDVVNDETGVFVPVEDVDAFVSALNSPFDISRYDNSAILERFSNDAVIGKWMELFDELDREYEYDMAVAREKKMAVATTPKKTKKAKKRKRAKLSERVKKAIRESSYFKGNMKYAEITTAWSNIKHHKEVSHLPLVSVIMPFYNNMQTVADAVRSVDKCGYKNYEIVMVNDGWSEDPRPLLQKYGKVRYFYKENGGVSSARNYALEQAKGKYVLFLDADDLLYPGCLTKLVKYAERHDLGVVAGKTIRHYVQEDRNETWYGGIYEKSQVNTMANRYLLIDDTISTAKLYSKSLLDDLGIRFRPGLYEDIAFMGELYGRVDRIGVLPVNTQRWMVYGTSTSITTKLTLDNSEQRIEKNDLVFDVQPDLLKVYYTRQFIRHTLLACVYPYLTYTEDEQRALYELLRNSMLKRESYVLDRLIVVQSKKVLYKSLLNDDFDAFDEVARGYSAQYYSIHSA